MPRVYSVGHSNRRADELVALLRGAAIEAVADVRRVPASTRHPWFGRGPLCAALAEVGLAYRWLGEGLGGRLRPTGPPETSGNRALRDEALRAYADAFTSPPFQRDLASLASLARRVPTALLCAERDWRRCHRQLLCDVLAAQGFEVWHLRDTGEAEAHVLHAWARVEDGRVTYPALL
jgi:uncharacterized protein (DUF488 family)